MSGRFDAIVIGAGPGGAEAAIIAARFGQRVALVDEQPAAGGQVWRKPIRPSAGRETADTAAGDELRRRLAESPVETFFGHRVWSVVGSAEGFRADSIGPAGPAFLEAPALVVATGAHERVTPFPGWTLPGVIGLAAATILLKSHGVAPGRRVAVAGCGPLLALVAAGLVKAGVRVAAVADLAARRDWIERLPAIARRPDLAWRGLGWTLRPLLAGVPLLPAHGVRRADGDGGVQRVTLGPVDQDGAPAEGREQTFEIDALVVGHGLTTASEIPRLLRADHRYDRLHGGWVPVTDSAFRTSLPGLYAIGDGGGIRGQAAATLAGQRVGMALREAGGGGAAESSAAGAIDAGLAKLRPFSDAMAGLMAQKPGQVAAIPEDCVICRCEDVTRRELKTAMAAGAADINQLKHFTRCGMGPCQGRYCSDTVQELMAQELGLSREAVGFWTGRPPLRPVLLGDIIGDFSYGDIPIPEPAPL
jgi:thioredoxin reductase/bacterioferritin-associated ferredoxin